MAAFNCSGVAALSAASCFPASFAVSNGLTDSGVNSACSIFCAVSTALFNSSSAACLSLAAASSASCLAFASSASFKSLAAFSTSAVVAFKSPSTS